jgi:hypothetical protein
VLSRSDQQDLIEHEVVTLIGQRDGCSRLNSKRLRVDLPATGAQSSRRASSLPAIIGSWRNSSWSFRSS